MFALIGGAPAGGPLPLTEGAGQVNKRIGLAIAAMATVAVMGGGTAAAAVSSHPQTKTSSLPMKKISDTAQSITQNLK
jgi:hypothetical protein